ncbi:MAG: hypothetical protein M1838_004908 [Thelocarpon superellum]|nr:MAG: hypothetical protein M1838_004908 [Thelocarpon superellum]
MGKKLIVCCDGTWLNSDNGVQGGGLYGNATLQVPSNVTRLCRAIKSRPAHDGMDQIVYYQAGVGTGDTWYDRIVGGGTGLGLSEHIREAYGFLANNYADGDQIFLVGFSRGAFTARSIAGFIGCIGLLTKIGLDSFYEIFKDYENGENNNYKPQYPDVPFANKPNIHDPRYTAELEANKLSRLQIPIKAVAVWDTVGSLGMPSISWLEKLGIQPANREYSFYDTKLDNHIENAFQALALDETRAPFSPTVWERPQGCSTLLKQCWFPGVHSNVGGGYDDTELANITLAWVMAQLAPFIDFDFQFLARQENANQQYYQQSKLSPRSWGKGLIYNSVTGVTGLAGTTPRTPGRYTTADPSSGKRTETLLHDTNEHFHASVRIRLGLPNMGTEDKGTYDPASLKDWKLVADQHPDGSGGPKSVAWNYVGKTDGVKVLPEDEVGDMEKALLRTVFGTISPRRERAIRPTHPTGTLEKRVGGAPLKVTNNCPANIYPAFLTQAGSGPAVGGLALSVGQSQTLSVSSDWQGRVWGRTNCSFNAAGTGASNHGGLNGAGQACVTGDCNGELACSVSGNTPVTLAEFLYQSASGQAFYDISLVDGYNLPIAIVLIASSSQTDIPPNLTNPVCIGTAALLASEGYDPYSSASTSVLGTNASYPLPFDQSQTASYVAQWCPWELQLLPPSPPASGVYPYPDSSISRPSFDPCFSACAKTNSPADCCTGAYNSPSACKPSAYSMNAKTVCPDAYSYAYDDQDSTFVIPAGGGFEVVFCPAGRSTNILATKGTQVAQLGQTGKEAVGGKFGNGTVAGTLMAGKEAVRAEAGGSTLRAGVNNGTVMAHNTADGSHTSPGSVFTFPLLCAFLCALLFFFR